MSLDVTKEIAWSIATPLLTRNATSFKSVGLTMDFLLDGDAPSCDCDGVDIIDDDDDDGDDGALCGCVLLFRVGLVVGGGIGSDDGAAAGCALGADMPMRVFLSSSSLSSSSAAM